MKPGAFIVVLIWALATHPQMAITAGSAKPPNPSESSNAVEIEVYAAILNASLSGQNWCIKPLRPEYLARNKERVIEYAEEIIREEKLTGSDKEAADNWKSKLYEAHLFTNQVSLPIKWQLVTDKDFQLFPKDKPAEWWKAFRVKYPDSRGIITTSRVGLSNDRQTAFLRWTKSVGELGMESAYLVLKKRDGRWHVERVLREIMA